MIVETRLKVLLRDIKKLCPFEFFDNAKAIFLRFLITNFSSTVFLNDSKSSKMLQ